MNQRPGNQDGMTARGTRPTARASVQVFDSAMRCSIGVCVHGVNPMLPQSAADLGWLAAKGVSVERFNLPPQPDAFAANGRVQQALTAKGTDCLPLILVNGFILGEGA